MNIAIINVLARQKSTGKIAYGLFSYLRQQGHSVTLYYGRRDDEAPTEDRDIIRISSDCDNYGHAALSRVLGEQGMYSRSATRKLLEMLEDRHTEVVYLLNLHGYYLNFPMLFDYLGKKHIKVIYLMLDEAAFLGKCCFAGECKQYQTGCGSCPQVREYPKSLWLDRSRQLFTMKQRAYAKIRDLTFVGIPYTVEIARQSALLRDAKMVELDEAVNLRELYYPRETATLRKQLGISAKSRVILTVSPYSDSRKGGRFFLQAAETLQDQQDLTFVYVGYDGDEKECPPNLIPISYVSDQNRLAEYYSAGDLFVCTSLAETVANTCLEALSCGTPLLGFRVCGIPYSADAQHGTFVEAKNVNELVRIIRDTPRKTAEITASCRAYAESRYDAQIYFEKLEKLCRG